MTKPTAVYIRNDSIRLGQFLKLAALVEDGAQAREVIKQGLVRVNDHPVIERGRQLQPGDTVTFLDFKLLVQRQAS
ncbi:MAG: RNA-binding S4 domain-containing protein [Rothia sp. (in: high G+C Gram-positive bacteria)]|nr:RNA-binding S4 domain-containing protein [Rothia sp. (in: high G+C Gram-positive bacteria)]